MFSIFPSAHVPGILHDGEEWFHGRQFNRLAPSQNLHLVCGPCPIHLTELYIQLTSYNYTLQALNHKPSVQSFLAIPKPMNPRPIVCNKGMEEWILVKAPRWSDNPK